MDGLRYLLKGMFRDDNFWDSWRGSGMQSRNKEIIHVQEGRSIRPNEDHEHGNGSNLAEERDYVVLDHIEQVPYQLATDKDAGRYVPILPQQNVRDCKAQTNEVMLTPGLSGEIVAMQMVQSNCPVRKGAA